MSLNYSYIYNNRNWRYEQEIAGLLWKIPKEEIHADLHGYKNKQFTVDGDKNEAYGSKVHLRGRLNIEIEPIVPHFCKNGFLGLGLMCMYT